MSVAPVITFTDPEKIPGILRVRDAMSRPDIRKVMGRGIANLLRKHFTMLDEDRPNKLGGDRTHFFAQARRGVQQPELMGGDGVKVSVVQVGIAQRYFGGEIVAKQAKFLTIPVNPAAYGHRAREFELEAIFFGDSGVLVKKGADSGHGIGEVYFRLVKRVYQKPDPTVLPDESELETAAITAGADYMQILIDREGTSA